jgi:endonuclease/exonuclease/phosphatase family metal-dependent hydrolase
MQLITWNVQWCRGIDGRVDPARIARTALDMATFDVLCLQEVAVGFASLAGSRGEDQMAELAKALPGYVSIFGIATDLPDGACGRSLFGNAVFTRLPVSQVFRHVLPWPADPSVPSMQRMALEVVVATASGPLRVLSTHLEYYSPLQRMAQVEALRHLHEQACGHARMPRPDTEEPGTPFSPAHRPASAMVCGDFNFEPHHLEHARITASFSNGEPALCDAWELTHPGLPHTPTVGLHENSLPECCFDFVFVTQDLAPRVRRVEVNSATEASDHQPVLVELNEE